MKGKCQVCGYSKKLKDGLVIYHERYINVGRSTSIIPCSGSGNPPKENK